MTSQSSSHDDFQSMTVSDDSTVSEGTRRLLSPYNRNRFDGLNRDIQNELTKVKDTFRTITNELNACQSGSDQFKEFKEKIRHANRILVGVKQRHDVLDDRNEQLLLDLQNHIWDLARYSVRIEIYFCAIERLKNTSNELLQVAKKLGSSLSAEYESWLEIGVKLKHEIHLLETRAKIDCPNASVRENLERLQQRCATILNANDRTQLKSLRNFPVKKSILNHCRNRLFD